MEKSGRGGQIRTDDFLLPKQALYQAELRPVIDWGRMMGEILILATANWRKIAFCGNFFEWRR